MSSRSGIGVDVHPLAQGRVLVLGGVTIPFEKGLEGHSDGDVLIHAIIDALLGATALGDIGTHFPSSDPQYKGIASARLLHETVTLVRSHHWRIAFVDATILAERPILKSYMPQIRQSLAATIGIASDCVSVKATTTDGLGFIGNGDGIAAMAVATIENES
jgi:2-C-methyl-D-erythritol 2,4-cyclodiphosphate synthase